LLISTFFSIAFLNLLAEARPNAKGVQKTADDLRKGATTGKPALRAVEPSIAIEGTGNKSDAIVTSDAPLFIVVNEG